MASGGHRDVVNGTSEQAVGKSGQSSEQRLRHGRCPASRSCDATFTWPELRRRPAWKSTLDVLVAMRNWVFVMFIVTRKEIHYKLPLYKKKKSASVLIHAR